MQLDMDAYKVMTDAEKIHTLNSWLEVTRDIYSKAATQRDALQAAITTALSDLDAVVALVGDTDPMAAVMLRGTQQRLREAMEGTSDGTD